MTRRLPPLNALKAFEASARLGSFVLAAAELSVTPGAVSQQIRKLEDFLGRQLFIRRNNQLVLTDVGVSVQAVSAQMMDGLAALTQQLGEGQVRSTLIISVLPSLGVRWLNRLLPDFLTRNPDVRVDLRLEDDPVDFFRDRIDARICYGEHLYPELESRPFCWDRVTAMCAPGYLSDEAIATQGLDALSDEVLVHTSWRRGFSAFPTWEVWFAAAGAQRAPQRDLGHTVDTTSLAVDFARYGCGVALGQFLLAGHDLAGGLLHAPFAATLTLQHPYCLVHAPGQSRSAALGSFSNWLAEVAPRPVGPG